MQVRTEKLEEQVRPVSGSRLWMIISIAIGTFGCIVGCVSLYMSVNTPKIGFVQSTKLIYGYEGMKEAQQQFQEKQRLWQINFDTLRMDFQRAVNQYNNEFSSLPENEKKQREIQLRKQEEQLIQYEQALKDKAGDEDRKMSQTVLDQVSGYIKEYRELHNYDVILGTTNGESVIAGSDRINITDDVLHYINKKHKSSTSKITPGSSDSSR